MASAKLRFFARDDGPDGPMLVNIPGARPATGQPPRYVARSLKIVDGVPSWVADSTPFECDADSNVGRRLLERIQNDTRDGYGTPLNPADKATADACGLPFSEPKAAPKPSRSARESESV